MLHDDRPRMLACDIDDTLLPLESRTPAERHAGNMALGQLCGVITNERVLSGQPFYFGSATGRTIVSHQRYESRSPELAAAGSIMDFKIAGVGAQAYYRTPEGFSPVPGWPNATNWDRAKIEAALVQRPELTLQSPVAQTEYKLSFMVADKTPGGHAAYVQKIAAQVAGLNVAAQVILSGSEFLDVLPEGIDKGAALRRIAEWFDLGRHQQAETSLAADVHIIAAGDSMNDCALLQVADTAILPGNCHKDLLEWARDTIPPSNLYVAAANFAAGILEGMRQRMLIP